MKPNTKADNYLHDSLVDIDKNTTDSNKKQMREAKRKIKKEISKSRRNADKQNLRKVITDLS